ncbi:MAG: LysE/ArgO family amino acid transporter [Pararhodobacter sp.]
MTPALIAGYLSGLSLIAAIGAQNAFVLRQGLRREHVALVVLVCAVSDALLIALGVAGFGAMSAAHPWLAAAMLWGGVGFLLVYGGLRFQAAWRGGAGLVPARDQPVAAAQVLLVCLVLTWANPHVWLDTVALLGALSTRYTPYEWAFGTGAILASFSFFATLGYGARFLAPVLARPRAWQVFEVLIGMVMWAIALALILRQLG